MGLRRSPGSSDVFFKVVLWFNLRIAVSQDVLKFDDHALDLLSVKLGANPNNKTGDTVHGKLCSQVEKQPKFRRRKDNKQVNRHLAKV